MQFSLLAWPTEVPSGRIPLSRGLPSASAMAVDTSGLLRSLPIPDLPRPVFMDPEAAALPYQALARFAATGAQVTEQVSNLVLAAEAKKREADNLAVSNSLYFDAALKIDEGLEDLKTKTDHTTLRPAYNDLFRKTTQDAVAQVPKGNEDVSRALQLKLKGLQVTKNAEVNDTVRKKTIDYHEGTLEKLSVEASRLITDPNTPEADRDLQIKNLENYYLGYAAMGLPKDNLVRIRERTLTTAYGTLAHQDLVKNPEQFLPKSDENPDGGDGWKKYAAGGKYPADGKYLNGLIDTTGPNLITRRNAVKAQQDRQREADTQMHITDSWGQRYDKLIVELDSGDPIRVQAASLDADILLREDTMGKYWTHGMKRELGGFLRTTRQQGGTTVDAVYNDLTRRLLENPREVSEDEIRQHGGLDLARTGDRSAASLIVQRRQLMKGDDVSQRPDYQLGHAQILTLQAGATDMMALMSPKVFGPANVAKNRDLYGDALAEYDREARKPEWKDKNLRDLGVQIRRKYLPLIYPTMQQGGERESTGGGGTGMVEVPNLEQKRR